MQTRAQLTRRNGSRIRTAVFSTNGRDRLKSYAGKRTISKGKLYIFRALIITAVDRDVLNGRDQGHFSECASHSDGSGDCPTLIVGGIWEGIVPSCISPSMPKK